MDFKQLASEEAVNKTKAALSANSMTVFVVDSGDAAKAKVLELLPKGAEVMDMSSVTLETSGLTKEIRESGNYDAVKNKLNSMDRATQGREMRKLGAGPDYAVGSVQAITETGQIFIASNTGSQLSAYVYGAGQVIWVVGTQKLVPDEETAKQRIFEYVLPLEGEHMKQLYGVPGSNVSKLLIVNKEIAPNRIIVILVKEALGF